jgi:hypothetical protein
MDLKGKVTLINGLSSAIGVTIAKNYLKMVCI